MLELTFAEQVKIVLSRKNMTIKELAELIEERTGKKMSRQNLTQRLSRDNFQEQDMRMIAGILDCPFRLSILDDSISVGHISHRTAEKKVEKIVEKIEEKPEQTDFAMQLNERDITVGEILDIHEELDALEEVPEEIVEAVPPETEAAGTDEGPTYTVEEILAEVKALEEETNRRNDGQENEKEEKPRGWKAYLHRYKKHEEPVQEEKDGDIDVDIFETDDGYEDDLYITEGMQEDIPEELLLDEEEDIELGEVNPYTGREYKTNSVRMHPDRIGYVQVYDRAEHKWTDMTEWAFLGYQERKKALLGKDYEPPIYLD